MSYFSFFDFFYNSLFPAIGQFFGQLIAISNITIRQLGQFMRDEITLSYTNIMTGVEHSVPRIHGFGIKTIMGWFNLLFENSVFADLPLWVTFLVSTIGLFFVLSLIRFAVHILFK